MPRQALHEENIGSASHIWGDWLELNIFVSLIRSNNRRDQMPHHNHDYWMELALREAGIALRRNEVPVGAVVVHNNAVIAKGSNQVEMLADPTAHAEMIALTAAASHLGNKRLENCTMYVTLEPCAMCAGAMVLARIPVLIFGAYDPKAGACSSLFTITNDIRLNHRIHTEGGVLREKCGAILQEFFLKQRKLPDRTR
jgi:tRNA(adenine34) deaminase